MQNILIVHCCTSTSLQKRRQLLMSNWTQSSKGNIIIVMVDLNVKMDSESPRSSSGRGKREWLLSSSKRLPVLNSTIGGAVACFLPLQKILGKVIVAANKIYVLHSLDLNNAPLLFGSFWNDIHFEVESRAHYRWCEGIKWTMTSILKHFDYIDGCWILVKWL